MIIRAVTASDRNRIFEILTATAMFTDDEIAAAMMQVDKCLSDGGRGDYVVHVAEHRDAPSSVAGFTSYGPTPKAEAVYDLYWIAVDPAFHGRGIGQELLRFVEGEVRAHTGRMLLIETSSRESYRRTQQFYEEFGYEEISRIKDFYRVQHDKVIYCKRLS